MITPRPEVDVELMRSKDFTQVSIVITSINGVELSAQTIVDAVSDALILKYELHELEPIGELDS